MTTVAPVRAAARSLEAHLADPHDPALPGSFHRALAADRAAAFPADLCRSVQEWGVADLLIPASCGGRLRGLEEAFELCRVLARRDLTAAIALGSNLLAALPVWLRGSAGQQAAVARLLRSGGYLSFALSERAHGADLVAGATTGTRDGDTWRLEGEKYLINNTGHAGAATITARTGTGPRGLTLFLAALPDAPDPGGTPDAPADGSGNGPGWHRLPKVATHGLRGSAIGGLALTGLTVHRTDAVGRPGSGLETILETFQITRVLVSGLALGALDTCLRRALGFARTRRLYGGPVLALEPVARRLVDAFADLLVGETVAAGACRAAHDRPGQLPLQSLCAKYLIPHRATDAIESLGVVLGARSYLTDPALEPVFEKMRRDCAVTGLFDGSAPVVLGGLADQLAPLAEARATGRVDTRGLPALFAPDPDEGTGTAPLDPDRMALDTDEDAVAAGLDRLAAVLDGPQPLPGLTAARHTELRTLTGRLRTALAALDAEATALAADPAQRRTGAAYDLAARYTHLHAAGACAWRWLAHREAAGPAGPAEADPVAGFLADGGWLTLCLRRLAGQAGVLPAAPAPDGLDAAALATLNDLYDRNLLFSVTGFPLAGRTTDGVS
ncbi:acyl-CoA dehydrogenase [Streptomyces cheonanensis]|uniref:Acyl-CoA dehydrogenase n=1 Tax=Streptomyces cheonanensis TaxID=312720 RepID=A0ABN2URB5_9ACTN|nr:acyl-CoA dehydrogenase [Streptomyces harbinensis]QKV68658.1 acyl-CoA dehydrogenase [Streptomyces harbinensis]